ncbi:hypothetical protein NSB25_14100 [Acetatifactor muris]|uniref:Yip1 domain protein n=1 Tax=Acetatifactor muris TaxID=879566 RepID=A0A2K4ZIB7_9FIRM|nr:hypothetical protein [Acetatifactor muris]MCR2048423.1 hypothetical protein [Acetatifactor muris]SOY30227.1 hypothetical protein AMURIS_02950 [Acetatifactor muris]
MAFCEFCGKELQEGEVCSCRAATAQAPETAAQSMDKNTAVESATQAPPVPPVQPAPAASGEGSASQPSVTITLPDKDALTSGLKKVLSTTLAVLKQPATEGRKFVEKGDKIAAIGIIAVQTLFSCLFSIIMVSRVNLALDLGKDYKFSGLKAFFLTLLFSLIFSGIMLLLLWGAAIIMKASTNLEQILSLTAVRSIGLLPMIILGNVFMIINTPTTISLGLVLYYGSFFLATVFLLGAVKGLTGVKDDLASYVVFGVMVVFILLFWLIGTKMALSLYIPGSIRDRIGNISSLMRMF